MTKQCVNCPGRTDHSTAECPLAGSQATSHSILIKDLKVDVFRVGPAGGFDTSMSSGVRITHLPTGIEVTSTKERSQHKNKEMAMSVLASYLTKPESHRDSLYTLSDNPPFVIRDVDGKYVAELIAFDRALIDKLMGDASAKPAEPAEQKPLEMAHIVRALESVPGAPMLTSNMCHAIAQALNAQFVTAGDGALLHALDRIAFRAESFAEEERHMTPDSCEVVAHIARRAIANHAAFKGGVS